MMKIDDFILTRGQQGFEDGKEIHPIEIKIESNKLQSIFERYKKTG